MLQSLLRRHRSASWCVVFVLLALSVGLSAAGSPARAESPVAVNLLLDRKLNKDFLDNRNEWFESGYVYAFQEVPGGGNLAIRLDAPDIMGLWKGQAPLRDDSEKDSSKLFYEASQFAPVFLVVDLTNTTSRPVLLTGAYLEMAASDTDLQPFVTVDSGVYGECGGPWDFDPDMEFLNRGWGPAEDAKLTFSFTNQKGSAGDDFVIAIGTLQNTKQASVLEALKASGANVAALKADKFKCPSGDPQDIKSCTQALIDAGLFGNMSSAVFPYGKALLTRVAGTLSYRWTDNRGNVHERQSPVAADVPLLEFDTGVFAECGGGGAVARDYKTVKLPLDRQNYRIPLRYREKLGPHENKRFALSLIADKASRHVFRVVLTLSDGSTAASPAVDLLYFTPRVPVIN